VSRCVAISPLVWGSGTVGVHCKIQWVATGKARTLHRGVLLISNGFKRKSENASPMCYDLASRLGNPRYGISVEKNTVFPEKIKGLKSFNLLTLHG